MPSLAVMWENVVPVDVELPIVFEENQSWKSPGVVELAIRVVLNSIMFISEVSCP